MQPGGQAERQGLTRAQITSRTCLFALLGKIRLVNLATTSLARLLSQSQSLLRQPFYANIFDSILDGHTFSSSLFSVTYTMSSSDLAGNISSSSGAIVEFAMDPCAFSSILLVPPMCQADLTD